MQARSSSLLPRRRTIRVQHLVIEQQCQGSGVLGRIPSRVSVIEESGSFLAVTIFKEKKDSGRGLVRHPG